MKSLVMSCFAIGVLILMLRLAAADLVPCPAVPVGSGCEAGAAVSEEAGDGRDRVPRDVPPRFRRLLEERWDACRLRLAAIRAVEDPPPQMLYIESAAQEELLRAELDICETLGRRIAMKGELIELQPCDRPPQRIAIRERLVENRREVYNRVQALSETGRRGGEAPLVAAARAALLTAEIDLLREQHTAAKPSSAPVHGDRLRQLLIDRFQARWQQLAALRAIDDPTPATLYQELAAHDDLLRAEFDICELLGQRVAMRDGTIELEQEDKSVQRIAIREKMVAVRRDVHSRVKALFEMGRRGGESFREAAARAALLTAEIDLLREQSTTLKAPSDASRANTDRLRQLFAERRAARQQQLAAIRAQYETRAVPFSSIVYATSALLESELEAASTPGQRIEIRKKMLDNRRAHEEYVWRLNRLGRTGGENSHYQRARAERALAELELLREQLRTDPDSSPNSLVPSPAVVPFEFTPLPGDGEETAFEESVIEAVQVILQVLNPEGKVTDLVGMDERVLDNLPELFRKLPDGRYRIFFNNMWAAPRLLLDVHLRGGRPADAAESDR